MDRKKFLKTLGAGAAFALSFNCLAAAGPIVNSVSNAKKANIALDLNKPTYSALKDNGGYVIVNGNVVVAKDLNGNYVAATRVCSHDNLKKVVFKNGKFECTKHGAKFSLDGKGLNRKARKGIKIFKTSLEGNVLKIYT